MAYRVVFDAQSISSNEAWMPEWLEVQQRTNAGIGILLLRLPRICPSTNMDRP